MTPPEKKDEETCCYALVRVQDQVKSLEEWRLAHESSPGGMHAVTRQMMTTLDTRFDRMSANQERILSRQNQILAALVGSGALLVVNLIVEGLIKR